MIVKLPLKTKNLDHTFPDPDLLEQYFPGCWDEDDEDLEPEEPWDWEPGSYEMRRAA